MSNKGIFRILLEEPCSSEYYSPPEDPLGELSDFEMGVRWFCFEWNHRISIQCGDKRVSMWLFPDVVLLLEWLPERILELQHGKTIELDFPERFMIVRLVPADGKVKGALCKWGHSPHWVSHFEAEVSEVVETLRQFLDDLMQRAVEDGYVDREQVNQFLSQV